MAYGRYERCRQTSLIEKDASAGLNCSFGVVTLMIMRDPFQRHENRREPYGGQLGNRSRSRATECQICSRQQMGVLLGRKRALPVSRRILRNSRFTFTRDMDHVAEIQKLSEMGGDGFVEGQCTLAATKYDEDRPHAREPGQSDAFLS